MFATWKLPLYPQMKKIISSPRDSSRSVTNSAKKTISLPEMMSFVKSFMKIWTFPGKIAHNLEIWRSRSIGWVLSIDLCVKLVFELNRKIRLKFEENRTWPWNLVVKVNWLWPIGRYNWCPMKKFKFSKKNPNDLEIEFSRTKG